MRRFSLFMLTIGLFVPMLASAPAHAQATRTWISGLGDDVNPCSRTAPCKTFAGAISKTAAGGEIDCLDPGGFGTITITKSITLDCGGGGIVGSILATGTNGVTVNTAGINVVLRNITINGAGTTLGTRGINIVAADSVVVENVAISNFSQQCIADVRSSAGTLAVVNSSLRYCAIAGIGAASTGGPLKLLADRVRATNNGIGMSFGANVNAMIRHSDLSNNTGAGLDNSGGNAVADSNAISNNGTGVSNSSGTSRLSNNDIMFNTTGINVTGGTTVTTYATNRNNGNVVGTLTSAGSAGAPQGQQ
jgi:hypothetical protein